MGVEGGVAHLQDTDHLTVVIHIRTGDGIVGCIHAEDIIGIFVHEGLYTFHGSADNLRVLHGIANQPCMSTCREGRGGHGGGSSLAVDTETCHIIDVIDTQHAGYVHLVSFLVDDNSLGSTTERGEVADCLSVVADEDTMR